MAELHIIGRIQSAQDFKQNSLSCKWSFHAGSGWNVINGCAEGQTQECCDIYLNVPVWDHPLDLHYTTQTLQGSPKLLVQIFSRDNYGRLLFIGYGVVTVPLTPGSHELKCHAWKPVGGWQDRLKDRFLGTTLQLKNPKLLTDSDDRFDLLTESVGYVNIDIHVIAKNFSKFGCYL